jgi:hypothetical protein
VVEEANAAASEEDSAVGGRGETAGHGGRCRGRRDEEGVAMDAATRRALPWTPRRGGELGSGDEAWTTRLCR